MAGARKYTDLDVWQLTDQIRDKTGRLTASDRTDGFGHSWIEPRIPRAHSARSLSIISETESSEISHLVKRAVAALTRLIVYLESASEPTSSDT